MAARKKKPRKAGPERKKTSRASAPSGVPKRLTPSPSSTSSTRKKRGASKSSSGAKKTSKSQKRSKTRIAKSRPRAKRATARASIASRAVARPAKRKGLTSAGATASRKKSKKSAPKRGPSGKKPTAASRQERKKTFSAKATSTSTSQKTAAKRRASRKHPEAIQGALEFLRGEDFETTENTRGEIRAYQDIPWDDFIDWAEVTDLAALGSSWQARCTVHIAGDKKLAQYLKDGKRGRNTFSTMWRRATAWRYTVAFCVQAAYQIERLGWQPEKVVVSIRFIPTGQ